MESKLEDGPEQFSSGLQKHEPDLHFEANLQKLREYDKDLLACFVDLEKVYDRVPRDKLWKVLQDYGVDDQLLRAIKSFYCQPEVCVRVTGKQSKPFHVELNCKKGVFCHFSFSLLI